MRRSVLILAILLLAAHGTSAQVLTERNQQRAKGIARQHGWWVRSVGPDGRVIELQAIVRGMPRYYTTLNLNAADTVSTDECWPGGASGLNLTGQGITLGVWDGGGVRVTHNEFGGRAVQSDSPDDVDDHATHVSGTMIAAGRYPGNDRRTRGMSYQGTLKCYDWNDDLEEMSAAAANALRVSNHSYGSIRGWFFYWGNLMWYWFGDVTVSTTEDYCFGRYEYESQEWDDCAYQNPYYVYVVSAGNDRGEGPSPGTQHYYWNPYSNPPAWQLSTATRYKDGYHQGGVNPGYDCLEGTGVSKNGLTVGAVNPIGGGYQGPTSVVMSSFSCWGPADDGRIKPDLVADGVQVLSCVAYDPYTYQPSDTSYDTYSGTSMAAPSVAGSLGLLIEEWRRTHPEADDMLSSTLKAVVIHTADEAGSNPGPDYAFGWGLLNTRRAAELIAADVATLQPLTITEWELRASQDNVTLDLSVDPNATELRATICWTDPPGTPPADTLNNRQRMLVNDLDLRITAPDNDTHYPWLLDPNRPTAAATRADNAIDNVEQVVITGAGGGPLPQGTYVLRVSHKGALTNLAQKFALVITGLPAVDCNGNGVADATDIANGTSQDCNQNAVPDECEQGLVPTITSQPSAAVACEGRSVTFTVSVQGYEPLSYQWRKGGAPLEGATQSTYTIAAVTPADVGSYDVVVTSACGTVTSAAAALTIQELLITAQPQSQSVQAGGTATLSVTTSGSALVTYQWRKDGQPIAAAVQPTYVLNPVVPDHAGTYDVVVTSPCGPVVSGAATLTVTLAAPASPTPGHEATGVSVDADLSWGGVFGAAAYDVHFGTTAAPPWLGSSAPTGWQLDTLAYSTTYYWKIVARNGALRSEGPLWSFTTKPEPPRPPAAPSSPFPPDGALDVPLAVQLGWGAAAGATVYKVLLGEDAELKDARFQGSTLATNWGLATLEAGQTYYWRIIARNDAGYTAGAVWSFTTAKPLTPAPTPSPGEQPAAPPPEIAADTGRETPDTASPPETENATPAAGAALCPATSAGMLITTLLGLWGTASRGLAARRRRE